MMNRARSRRAPADGGFTLVELLVVIAILGILAAVAVFAIGGTAKTSKGAACNTDIDTVQTASDAYFAKNNAFAANVDALVTAKFLRSKPTTSDYVVSVSAVDGAATASPLCTTF